MKRRPFIQFIAGGAIGAVGFGGGQRPVSAAPAPEGQVPPESVEAGIARLFSDSESARSVGWRYLERFPEQASRERLLEDAGLAALPGDLPGDEPLLVGSLLKAALNQRREQDFLAGDTVILGGWILARSEASLCALLALSPE